MIRPAALFLLLFAAFASPRAQELYRKEITLLCSEKFSGRGYVGKGQEKAAGYIEKQFRDAGLAPLGKSFFQPFYMPVNTFPSAMELRIDSKELLPGKEFLVKASSPSVKGTFELLHIGREALESDSLWNLLLQNDLSEKIAVLDTMSLEEDKPGERYKKVQHNALKAKAVIIKTKKRLLWTVARQQAAYAVFEVDAAAVSREARQVTVRVKSVLKSRYKVYNVAGYVKGTAVPDSFLVVTAHYDHLGRMGAKTVFPGAHDNASGTVMMLELMRHYARNPHRYSIAFIAFGAEEAGLVGSKFFVENPLMPLASIRFLLNLDLEGTGSGGATVVNATEFPAEFDKLKAINASENFLSQLLPRGKAANSDHYWFSENGVPAFFLYQMGEYAHYHDPGDMADKLPLTHFEATMDLVKQFFLIF
jgi:aminopeptidase YwaD